MKNCRHCKATETASHDVACPVSKAAAELSSAKDAFGRAAHEFYTTEIIGNGWYDDMSVNVGTINEYMGQAYDRWQKASERYLEIQSDSLT